MLLGGVSRGPFLVYIGSVRRRYGAAPGPYRIRIGSVSGPYRVGIDPYMDDLDFLKKFAARLDAHKSN